MNFIKKTIIQLLSIFILFVLAAIPLALQKRPGEMVFEVGEIGRVIQQFFSGFADGEVFYYRQGTRERDLFVDLPEYFLSSLKYIGISGFIIIILTFIFGIWFWKVSEKTIARVIGVFGLIPDFIFILGMQIFVVTINKTFGIKLAKVASSSVNEPAVLLPILALIVIPLAYVLQSMLEQTKDVLAEDYILTAKSKGLPKIRISLFHITSNVTPFLKSDLHKILSIMISNMFIVEYLFNTRGITSLLFLNQMKFGYQYNLVIFSFLSLFILYVLLYLLMRFVINVIERCVSYD